jgi:hypothetical protein
MPATLTNTISKIQLYPNSSNWNTNSTSSAYHGIFDDGTAGILDVMNDCSNRPYLSTNVTGAIKNFTSIQQVNDCDSGYDHGWNKYCHIGLARHPNAAADCPGIFGPKETKSSRY